MNDVPHIYLKTPFQALKPRTVKGAPLGFAAYPFEPGHYDQVNEGQGFDFIRGELVAATCQIARGMVLTRDCDIDSEGRATVALVRVVPPNMQEENKAIIRRNGNHAHFYLVSIDDMPESFVDFTRLTTLDLAYMRGITKVASLAQRTVEALLMQYILYRARREGEFDAHAIDRLLRQRAQAEDEADD